MIEINAILEQARKGDEKYASEILDYLQSFKQIILRGAGNFGSEFGSFLIQKGFKKTSLLYWDKRAVDLIMVSSLLVAEPFSSKFSGDDTLVINCIPNGSLSGSVGKSEFNEKGYPNYLSGMALFEALMCGMKAEIGFNGKVCIDTKVCNWCACKRLPSLLQKHCKTEELNQFTDELFFPLATFVINQKCTLSCTHCGQYINHYQKEDRINFSLSNIKDEIDKILDAVDSIGYISIIGGEPFMHPQLDDIIAHVLTKPNFGVIGITTNGICDIDEAFLDKLKESGYVRLIFSDYTATLSDNQKKLFNKNVEKAKSSGISYTVGQPIWTTPASLRKLHLSEADKIAKKAGCNSKFTCKTIQNGVYYPCSTSAGLGSHHMADFENDWAVITKTDSAAELRAKIKHVDEQPFYESCDHCGESGEMLNLAGEQGVSKRYRHIEIIPVQYQSEL